MIGLGSSAQLGIGIAISLQNRFSSDAQRINSQLKQLKQNSNNYLLSAARDYRNQAAIVGYAAAQMTRGLYSAAQEGSGLVHRLRQIAIVGRDANLTYTEAEKLTKRLAIQYAQTLPEAQSAVFENVKAGIKEGLDYITEYQIAVSKATDELLGGEQGVAKGLISIMNAYQLETKQFGRIANAVTAAANSSQSSVYSLTEAMKYSGHTFHELNIPLEESLALLARLSQAGIEGSSAGTAMQNALNQMSKAIGEFSTPKKQKALQMLGLTAQDFKTAEGEFKPLIDIIKMVEARSIGLTGPRRKSILSELFNIRGERGIINLFGNFGSNPQQSIDYYLKEIRKGIQSDVARTQAREMTSDLASDFIRLRTAVQDLYRSISDNPIFRFGIKVVTKFFQGLTWFAETGVGKIVVGLAAVVTPTIAAIALFRAATLTAALALRSLSISSGIGAGYRGLLGGVLGSMGLPFTRNAAGRMIVAKGQTMNIGGKLYKGGQLLPKGTVPTSGMMGVGQGIGSLLGSFIGTGARNTAQLSTIGKGVTGVLGVASKFLPMLGTLGLILAGVQVLSSLMDDKRQPMTSEEIAYSNFLSEMAYKRRMGPDVTGAYERMMGNKPLNINMTVNVDGQKAFDKKLEATMDQMVQGSGLNVTW